MIALLNKLALDGTLAELCKNGLISFTIIRDRDLYLAYDIYKRQGYKSMEAKQFTADDFNVSLSTVEKAVKNMAPKVP